MIFYTATTNSGKISEFVSLMKSTGHQLKPIEPIECPEDEDSFRGNAIQKAQAYAYAAEGYAFAEDSGLVVPALDGEPGVYSARYAVESGPLSPAEASEMTHEEIDQVNNDLLMRRMEGEDARDAAFVCSIAAVKPTGQPIFQIKQTCHGWIAEEPRGSGGFGYDPVFVEKTTGSTFAQLDKARKNLVSHRRKSMRHFKEWLAYFGEER